MSGFVEGMDRSQSSLFPAELEDYVAEDNLVRAVDAFVDGLDLGRLGFGRFAPLERGRPCYHPATLLKLYIYGYLNRVPSTPGARVPAQYRADLADGASGTGLQDHCGF